MQKNCNKQRKEIQKKKTAYKSSIIKIKKKNYNQWFATNTKKRRLKKSILEYLWRRQIKKQRIHERKQYRKKCRKNGSANILNRVKVDVVTSYVKD